MNNYPFFKLKTDQVRSINNLAQKPITIIKKVSLIIFLYLHKKYFFSFLIIINSFCCEKWARGMLRTKAKVLVQILIAERGVGGRGGHHLFCWCRVGSHLDKRQLKHSICWIYIWHYFNLTISSPRTMWPPPLHSRWLPPVPRSELRENCPPLRILRI